jgi:serine/threonine protein kinase
MAVTDQLNKLNRDVGTEKVLTTLELDLAATKGLNKSNIDAERERQKVLSTIELVFAVRLDEIQLNKQLCRYLRKQLGKMRNAVEFLNEALGTMLVPDIYRSACEELRLVVKRVENLQQRCKTLPWLDAAITLANVKEEVLELLLDLSWWTHMLKIATNNSGMGGSGVTQKVEAAVMKLEALFEKLRKEGSSFQKASQADKEYLVSRLQGVLEEKRTPNGERSTPVTHDHEYILATYLLFRIKEDPIAPDVEPQLKHYGWVNHLGRGANGEVSEVTWLNQNCAHKSFTTNGEKEVTLLKVCSHPHIVQYFWHWQEGRKSHMMMELMPENLSTHLDRRNGTPFPLHVAIDIMLQIAKAMQYLHSQKIVHRDLKPLNILVKPLPESSDGYIQVKLADFGVSKFYNNTKTSSPQTHNVGTSVYAAPEVFTQEVVLDNNNPKFPSKADVWSFAMVCSEILTGERPFIDQQRDGLHDQIKKSGIRPQLPNDCPYDLRFCITQCWDLDPKRRPKFNDVYKMLNVAKARSLGILHFDTFKHLFSLNQHLLSKSLKFAR